MTYEVPSYALYYDDEAEIRDAYWNPGPGEHVIDIGARYGSYTLPALAAGAMVLAVDPHRGILELLQAAANVNGFDALQAMCVGLYDDTPYPRELLADIGEVCPSFEAVQWTTLDKIADEADLVKIDVEGAELGVLYGGLRLLAKCRPRLLIEDHTRVYPWCEQNRIRERMHDLLLTLGYTVESVPYEAPTGSPRDFTIAT